MSQTRRKKKFGSDQNCGGNQQLGNFFVWVSNPGPLVNTNIAGKWIFVPKKWYDGFCMVLFDRYRPKLFLSHLPKAAETKWRRCHAVIGPVSLPRILMWSIQLSNSWQMIKTQQLLSICIYIYNIYIYICIYIYIAIKPLSIQCLHICQNAGRINLYNLYNTM